MALRDEIRKVVAPDYAGAAGREPQLADNGVVDVAKTFAGNSGVVYSNGDVGGSAAINGGVGKAENNGVGVIGGNGSDGNGGSGNGGSGNGGSGNGGSGNGSGSNGGVESDTGNGGGASVPSIDDIMTKGYYGAFEKLIPKQSYEEDIRRAEKQQAFDLLANIGRVGMQSLSSLGRYGERKFDPIQDNMGKYSDKIDRFKELQRAADLQHNRTILSLAMQQKKDDEAAALRKAEQDRKDEQFQWQKANADRQFQWQKEKSERDFTYRQGRDAANDDYRNETLQLQKDNAERQQKNADRSYGFQVRQYEDKMRPKMAFTTKYGDVYLKDEEDKRAMVFGMLQYMAKGGDRSAQQMYEDMKRNGGKPTSKEAIDSYDKAEAYVSQRINDNDKAVRYLFSSVENEGGEIRRSDTQDYNNWVLYHKGNPKARERYSGRDPSVRHGGNGQGLPSDNGQSSGQDVKKPNPMGSGEKKANPMN